MSADYDEWWSSSESEAGDIGEVSDIGEAEDAEEGDMLGAGGMLSRPTNFYLQLVHTEHMQPAAMTVTTSGAPRARPNGRVENRCFMFCASIGREEQKLSLDTLKGRRKARAECTFQCTANTVADRVFDIYYNVLDGPKPSRARRHSNTSGGSTTSSGGSRGSTGSGSRKRAPETEEEDTATGTQRRPVWSAAVGRASAVAGIGAAASGMAAEPVRSAFVSRLDFGDGSSARKASSPCHSSLVSGEIFGNMLHKSNAADCPCPKHGCHGCRVSSRATAANSQAEEAGAAAQDPRRTADSEPDSMSQASQPRAARTRSTAAGAGVSAPNGTGRRRQPQPRAPSPLPPQPPLPHQQRQHRQNPPQGQQQNYGQQQQPQPQPQQEQEQHQDHVCMWASVFVGVHGGGNGGGTGPQSATSLSLDDLRKLHGAQLASLARQWVEEVVAWEQGEGRWAPSPDATTAPPSAVSPSVPNCEGTGTALVGCQIWGSSQAAAPVSASAELAGGGSGAGSPSAICPGQSSLLTARLPPAVAAQLAVLTAAVDAHMTRGSLGHQELADLACEHSLRVLAPAMGVPFSVVPRFMPELRLNDFMSEVELRRDTIYLDDGGRAVEESRRTGWQSEIGATFRYSGKEMQPQPGGLSTHIRQVRDRLWELTGVKYDSVLINYYADGKCGMRYHVDPLYDRWTPNSAVVSLGDTRAFIFRAINDHNTRWHYRVRNGDVVLMFDDCQDRLQHCVRVEKRAADAGPRMSLVFKERLRGPTGHYLLP
ncbi:hypothetical protein VOLCADRAFT_104423 [Volvox carteri f. nagariensis]|uniref:Fe2OG dioxygenase domain-containing protein n=1 Tax=Volvox carteri f. nagariensis TaxID=3068 RepID=D8TTJ2_VOLCA|nr:uncharacterized protein VOLCADRAFT_104423 [Volvox carteri f. nagariensis]EFJ49206.1 hypothetical protein VOLCADRAFT_104423 [Volvox carteri f. nagariensis]|eukprot:XP_002949654.1 hypothetical protein VOLCADRAFT_104423 [Volvox carteri f. nagariensis]